jgi:predicted alpha/beta-fold hydrolase
MTFVTLLVQFYSASFLGDMCEVVEHVGMRYPKANLYAVGWSLGANILVRYVGQVCDMLFLFLTMLLILAKFSP